MPDTVLEQDGVRVTIENIGEGWNGDYDPDDPDDKPLLRFTVDRLVNGEWEQVEDASYCTAVVDDGDEEKQARMARKVMDEVGSDVQSGMSIKRLCEDLSWMGARWQP